MADIFVTFKGDLPLSQGAIDDFLHLLNVHNLQELQAATPTYALFQCPEILEILFGICDYMELDYDVKYVAVTLLERFMLEHSKELEKFVGKQLSEKRPKVWRHCMKRLPKLMSLRIFSCIQIASKLQTRNEIVGISQVKEMLLKTGMAYTTEAILASEVRVLKTINFRISVVTPLYYVETLLKILQIHISNLPMDRVANLSVNFLNFVLMCREGIYEALYQICFNNKEYFKNRHKFVKTIADLMILACAIIVDSIRVFKGSELARKVAHLMSDLCKIHQEDIELLAAVIYEAATFLRPVAKE